MKKEKVNLSLDFLKVDSFVTNLKSGQEAALLGGRKKKGYGDEDDTTTG